MLQYNKYIKDYIMPYEYPLKEIRDRKPVEEKIPYELIEEKLDEMEEETQEEVVKEEVKLEPEKTKAEEKQVNRLLNSTLEI